MLVRGLEACKWLERAACTQVVHHSGACRAGCEAAARLGRPGRFAAPAGGRTPHLYL